MKDLTEREFASAMREMRLSESVDVLTMSAPMEVAGRFVWWIESGAIWQVQAKTRQGAIDAVIAELRREGIDAPDDLADLICLPPQAVRKLTRLDVLECYVKCEGRQVPLIELFTGEADAVLSCSEWDGD